MRLKFLIPFLLFYSVTFCQEIGNVKVGTHFVKLLKIDNLFSLVYSDVKSVTATQEKSFNFPNKETIYSILINGFNRNKGHQIIVQTNKDTIVKFNFKKLNGEYMLYVYQNNLNSNTFGRSAFFTKNQIIQLFGG
ncbi:hypothetical protein MKD41_09910 [Lutibacter sp. A64]|uniref:hypothetical protein n=1 Tax=Lutibacter sp. A64 TaxID=2918526 RepID=UPI001F061C13|nr:hypothetical protein [Lutibacter sp. A64]UMB52650.1 hypothetical protein MKD41_09910 [Lutibacter sp. A64]